MSKLAGDGYYNDKGFEKVSLLTKVEPGLFDVGVSVTTRLCERLSESNFAVIDDFIEPQEALDLRSEVAQLYSSGRMQDGEIGTGGINTAMRTDKMIWLEGNESFVGPFMKRHIARCDIYSQKVAAWFEAIAPQHTWTGCSRTKVMATVYAGSGAHYVPHYDNPNRNGRKLTMILYLNPTWQPAHGGVLRMKTARQVVDVAPLCNRLLCFWSDRRCPHEVLPATGPDRFAITIWYLDDAERDAFLASSPHE